MASYTLIYIIFLALLGLSILFDFWIFRHKNTNNWRIYLWQLLFWLGLALAFAVGLWIYLGADMGLKFLSAYFLEFSLSMDNVFVFILIFSSWSISLKAEHKALFWGIIIAIILRIIFIFMGVKVVEKFSWIMYIFGAFLIYTGIKLLFQKNSSKLANKPSFMETMLVRYLPINSDPAYSNKLLIRINGRWFLSVVGLVIILMGLTDLIFALDSIPSVIGLLRRKSGELFTAQEILIMYSSNIFAVIGLRPLYLLLKRVSQRFHLLSYAIAIILMYVGLDLLLELFNLHIPYQVFPILLFFSLSSAIILSNFIKPSSTK